MFSKIFDRIVIDEVSKIFIIGGRFGDPFYKVTCTFHLISLFIIPSHLSFTAVVCLVCGDVYDYQITV